MPGKTTISRAVAIHEPDASSAAPGRIARSPVETAGARAATRPHAGRTGG